MLFGLYSPCFKVAFEETLWGGLHLCLLCLPLFVAHHFAMVNLILNMCTEGRVCNNFTFLGGSLDLEEYLVDP